MANYRILRADAPRPTKIIGILLVTGASYLIYSVVASMVRGWFGR